MRIQSSTLYIGTAQTLLWGSLYYLFPALLLQWETHYGWQRSELTLALAIAVIISAVFAPLAGQLIDRGKGVLMQPLSALGGALLLATLPYVTSLSSFYMVWALIGICMAGCLYEACFAFVIRHQGESAKRSITLITLMAGFASTICFPLAAWLAEHFSVNVAIQVFAGSIILIAVPLFWLGAWQMQHSSPVATDTASTPASQASAGPAPSQIQNQASHYLRQPVFWLLAASFTLLTVNHGVVLNHLLPILDSWQISDSVAVLTIAMIGPMQVLGRLLWMAFDKHFSVIWITAACFAGINLATLSLIFASNMIYLLIAFAALQGASYGVISITKPLVIREVMGSSNFGAISGAMAVPYLLGFAAAPYIGSLIWQWQGYNITLWSIFALSIAALMCLTTTVCRHKKQHNQPCCQFSC